MVEERGGRASRKLRPAQLGELLLERGCDVAGHRVSRRDHAPRTWVDGLDANTADRDHAAVEPILPEGFGSADLDVGAESAPRDLHVEAEAARHRSERCLGDERRAR